MPEILGGDDDDGYNFHGTAFSYEHCLMTPLHYAALYGNVEVLKLLLHHGASPFRTNRSGELPFECVATTPRRSAPLPYSTSHT